MKQIILVIVSGSILLISCGKTGLTASQVVSFNLINAQVGSLGIVPAFAASGTIVYNGASSVGYGSSFLYSTFSGKNPLTLAQVSDTTTPFFSGTFTLKLGGIYSLFVAGDVIGSDTLFSIDNIPVYPFGGDSVTGVRLVNLSKGTNPISVDIAGTPNTPVTANVAYKDITAFQSYAANTAAITTGYTFEFRDAISDSLLTTFALNIVPFKSQTLAFYGNATVGFAVMSINNF
jgi:hypothetical protein